MQIADGNTATYFLTTFGRATRETVCSCEVKMEPNLGQALHLMNGENVHEKIKQGGVVAKLLEAEEDAAASCRRIVFALPQPQADRPKRLTALDEQLAGVADPKAAVGRRVLGTAQFARIRCSIIRKRVGRTTVRRLEH